MINLYSFKKILLLNFLAPKLKEAIINSTQLRHLKLADLMNNVPLLWNEQEEMFGLMVI
jgi:site-specific DNA recombinase